VKQPVNGQLLGGDGIGDGIDEEGHVVIDEADPHPPVAGFAAGGFDGERKLARLAAGSELGEELRGVALGFAGQALGFTGERVSGQRLSD